MITEETISRVKSSLQATKSFLALEVIEQIEKENEELKAKLNGALDICNVNEFLKQKEDNNLYSELTDEELDEINLINECTNPND